MNERCNSCNIEISVSENSVFFKCPNCVEETIYRCNICRKRMVKYKCPKCGFEGP